MGRDTQGTAMADLNLMAIFEYGPSLELDVWMAMFQTGS